MFTSSLRNAALLSIFLGLTVSPFAYGLNMEEDVIHFGNMNKTAPTADQMKADQVVTDNVMAAVKKDKDLFAAVSSFDAKTMGGIVTVTGSVKTEDVKTKLLNTVKGVDGVFGIIDQVTITK